MKGIRDDLIVALEGIDPTSLLEFWRWLIPDSFRPWFATALGDLFFQAGNGEIWWLEVGSGTVLPVAQCEDQFHELVVDPEKRNYWFGEPFVDELRASGLLPGPGECYSFQLLPILGGEYRPSNFRVYDVVTHFRVWGPIHEKMKDIPDGTSVKFEVANNRAQPRAPTGLGPDSGSAGATQE